MNKPKEKVMMMVPMMVPHDAVNRIAQGYPASHQYCTTAVAAANPHQWMAGAMSQASMAYTHQPAVAAMQGAGGMTHPGMHQYNPSAPPPAPAGAPPNNSQPEYHHSHSAPPQVQPFAAGNMPPPAPANAPQPPGTPNGGDAPTQGQVPAPAPGYAPAPPHALQGVPQQHAAVIAMPPAMSMYPQATNGMPSVAFDMQHSHAAHHGAPAPPYPYAQQHAALGQQHPHQAAVHPHAAGGALHPQAAPMAATGGAPPPAAASLAAAHAAAQQQQQHGQAPLPAPQGTSQHPQMAPPPGTSHEPPQMSPPGVPQPPPQRQPSSEKLTSTTTTHQGNSGGNLAHCA
mmetsp:Transcript_19807/g.47570  ORF Transcript_19807/g.47570 Transcript_19807/m.47570 type:complete len:342 (-) Transcript_19807:263-1288(-)